ncbi:ABC transporter ATP-binding protein [Candidatus Harpocratesius sp.]
MAQTPKIEIKDLVKIYKQGQLEVLALRGVNAEIYPGEIVIIEGPSGCGKTTLVNIIAGLDRQSAGDVLIYGNKDGTPATYSLAKMNEREVELFRRERIGVVFQFMNLIPTLNAEENVALPLLIQGVSAKIRREKAQKLLSLAKISERAKHKPGELSGGEQQRVAIAAALINNPDIIIADEPTGNLDTETCEEILDLFQSIMKQYPDKCLIIVTHDPAVERIANRIFRIRDGQLVVMHENHKSNLNSQEENERRSNSTEIRKLKEKLKSLKEKIVESYQILQEL